jgi:hypothetical protein
MVPQSKHGNEQLNVYMYQSKYATMWTKCQQTACHMRFSKVTCGGEHRHTAMTLFELGKPETRMFSREKKSLKQEFQSLKVAY